MTTAPFFDRLEAARVERGTCLCVGIDPRLERMPESLVTRANGDVEALLYAFGVGVVDAAAEHAACFKPQIAFFEAHGLAGLRAYARVVAEARMRGLLVIGDIKRGDIGSTAEAYAKAHLTPGAEFEVDCATINPYLGADSLAPFVDAAVAHGKGLFVLVRTSNPGAADLQERDMQGSPLFERVGSLVAELGAPHKSPVTGLHPVGAVVGATSPAAGAALRAALPDVPFLVPGYGAQGAGAADVVPNFRADGSGAVVNASRSINYPEVTDGDWLASVARAAQAAKEDLRGALVGS